MNCVQGEVYLSYQRNSITKNTPTRETRAGALVKDVEDKLGSQLDFLLDARR